jgi:ABC-2 type transport system ATP-binding protein
MSAVIQFDNVTKMYGGHFALNEVSLDVPEGSVFALLGENGAGKTTSLRILLGLVDADLGKTSILGLDGATQGVEIRRRVGYVPEQPDLYDWMSVREIGWFASGFHGEGYREGYRKLIEGFRIPPSKQIKSLSKGMKAKISLALALAHDPDVLILDEPTSGLDAIVRREFLESMVDRAALGKTVLLSSHQINEVERVADYVAIIRGGDLLTVEKLDEIKSDTFRVSIVLTPGDAALEGPAPILPGIVLEERKHGREYEAIVRGTTHDDLSGLVHRPEIDNVEISKPNLEEIFIAYMTRNDEEDKKAPAAAHKITSGIVW